MKYTEDAVKRILRTTPDCLTPERLSENLSESERQHVDTCSRCQAELRLWQEYEQGEVSPDEGAAVQWIVAELARRNAPVSKTAMPWVAWLTPAVRKLAAAAAAIVLVAAVGYLVWDREPVIRDQAAAHDTYRTGRVDVVGPSGDLREAPAALEWVAVDNAVSYDIEILEVDDTPLWRATSTGSRIDLPPAVVRRLVPGKTVLWQVRARTARNDVIAESGRQQFRVQLPR